VLNVGLYVSEEHSPSDDVRAESDDSTGMPVESDTAASRQALHIFHGFSQL